MSKITPIGVGCTAGAHPALALTSDQADDLHLTLTEAHALVDTIFLADSHRIAEELCEHTIATVMHVAMQKLEHALEVLDSWRSPATEVRS